jgi:hypothetical protein
MFDFVEINKPDSEDAWLTKEQRLEFESTYFDDEECALDIIIEIVSQNGLDKEFNEKSNLNLDIFPFKLDQTDYNPMIEAMANWNEYNAGK